MAKLLLIGKIPLPIGGVTVHVSRLMDHLNEIKYEYMFYNLHRGISKDLMIAMFKVKRIHLHTSNAYLRLFLTVVAKFSRSELILTLHGDLGRYNKLTNFIDILTLKWCSIPILLNDRSYKFAYTINSNSKQISAFLPPLRTRPLPNDTLEDLKLFCDGRKILCTNAYDLSFDKHGQEIYGLSTLLNACAQQNEYALVISEPTGHYYEFIKANYNHLLNQAFWLNFPHDFYEILKLAAAFVRNTTTDGDAISVREALHLRIVTLATGVVDRPEGVIVYEDVQEIFKVLKTEPTRYSTYDAKKMLNELMVLYEQA